MKSEHDTFEKEEVMELVDETGTVDLDDDDDNPALMSVTTRRMNQWKKVKRNTMWRNRKQRAVAVVSWQNKRNESEDALYRSSRLAQRQRRDCAQMDTGNFLAVS